jgi:hypothetical protein
MAIRTSFLCLLLAFLTLGTAGCTHVVKGQDTGTRNELEVALRNIPATQLTHCDTTLREPDNSVGSLLSDYNAVTTKGAACATKHNGLVDYLQPLLDKLGLVSPPAKP